MGVNYTRDLIEQSDEQLLDFFKSLTGYAVDNPSTLQNEFLRRGLDKQIAAIDRLISSADNLHRSSQNLEWLTKILIVLTLVLLVASLLPAADAILHLVKAAG